MTEHTALPWKVSEDDPFEIVSADYGDIAWVPNEPAEVEATIEEYKANARFIVTACNNHPDLLEALKTIQGINTGTGPLKDEMIDHACEQAIRKAEEHIK